MAPDPLIGRTFRGYRVERRIASGGMGAVYLARDEALPNVRKVIKIVKPDPDLDPAMLAFVQDRFEREAHAASLLEHDNVVKVHTVGVIDGDGPSCILMDYVEGQTLHEFLSTYPGGRVPAYRVLPIAIHIARGLDAAHALGVVHRDLKPANIILCPKDNDPAFCKLLDFGTAKLTKPLVGGLVPTMQGMAIGTPFYMSVEQFGQADEASPLSDVYSLAIIIWEMVTGDLPWGRHHSIGTLYDLQRYHAPAAPPPGAMSQGWERALRSALSRSRADRPASVRHLIVDLAIYLETTGPYVRSGVEILRAIAPNFIADAGPDDETLRNEPQRTIVVAWPRPQVVRVAAADLPTRRDVVHRGGNLAVSGGAPGRATPVMSSTPTTLGASNAVITANPDAPRGWRLGLLAVTAAALTTVGLYAVLNGRDKAASPSERSPAAAAPSTISSPPPDAMTTSTPSASAVLPPVQGEGSASPMPTSGAHGKATNTPPAGTNGPSAPRSSSTTSIGLPRPAGITAGAATAERPGARAAVAPATPVGDPALAPPSKIRTSAPHAPRVDRPRDDRAQKRKFDPEAPGGGE